MRRSARSNHRAVLALQTLEGREVPAGNVNASLSATGLLTLVGDNAANAITITATGASLTVTGNSGTSVNGLFPFVTAHRAVTAVQATMNGGDDVVRIDPAANFLVSGPVAVNLGPGNNVLGLQTAGRIALGSLSVGGGTGNDRLAVAGGVGTGSTITTTAAIGMGAGADAVTLRRIMVFGAVSVATGDGADTLAIDSSTFLGTFSAGLGAGNDAIRIAQQAGTAAPVNFGQAVSINARTGNDTLLLGRAATARGDANSRVIFHGGVIDGGGGFNFFDPVGARRTGPVSLLGWA
jgi:hypothetical protein